MHNHFYIGQKQATKIIESYYGSGRKLRDYFNKHCYRKWTRWIHSDEAKLLGLEREILDTAESIDELNNTITLDYTELFKIDNNNLNKEIVTIKYTNINKINSLEE